MTPGLQLSDAGEPLQGFALPGCEIAVNVINHGRLQYKKSPVNPGAIAFWLLEESLDFRAVSGKFERAKATSWLHCRQGGQATMAAMKFDARCNVDVTNAIPVGQTERIVQQVAYPLQATARHGLITGIDTRYPPGFSAAAHQLHGVCTQVEHDVGVSQTKIGAILLDVFTAVTQADDKIIKPEMCIDFHDMPKYWHTANFDHGFRPDRRFL